MKGKIKMLFHVENKCTNCAYHKECKIATGCTVIVWKHCVKFKPSGKALEAAKLERELAKKHRYRAYAG